MVNTNPEKTQQLLTEAEQIALSLASQGEKILVQLATTFPRLEKLEEAERVFLLI